MPYVSPFHDQLQYQGIFDIASLKDYNREVWDTYPIYLKHTVFHESEDWDTARKMEIGHRFFIGQNLKDRANKRFKRGHYHRAIALYEKALSLCKWLKCEVNMDENPFDQNEMVDKVKTNIKWTYPELDHVLNAQENIETKFKVVSDISETEDTANLQENSDPKKPVDQLEDPETSWMKDKYHRLLLTTFHDGNITLHDKDDIVDHISCRETRVSLMTSLLVPLACAYMKLSHWHLANQALDEVYELVGEKSLLNYWKAMCIACNLDSSLSELKESERLMDRAIKIKDNENLFKAPSGVLNRIGLGNHEKNSKNMTNFIHTKI